MAVKKVLVTSRDALPEKKISVNQHWMLEWLSKYGTLDDVEWFEKVCADNPSTFQSNLDGQTYQIPDWAKVRAQFLRRFFPGSYAKKPQAKRKQEKFEDKLSALKARKQMERDQVKLEEPAPEPQAPATGRGRKK